MLTSTERQLLVDRFDVYDLVEALQLTAADIVDAFDTEVEDNEELMEFLGGGLDVEPE